MNDHEKLAEMLANHKEPTVKDFAEYMEKGDGWTIETLAPSVAGMVIYMNDRALDGGVPFPHTASPAESMRLAVEVYKSRDGFGENADHAEAVRGLEALAENVERVGMTWAHVDAAMESAERLMDAMEAIQEIGEAGGEVGPEASAQFIGRLGEAFGMPQEAVDELRAQFVKPQN